MTRVIILHLSTMTIHQKIAWNMIYVFMLGFVSHMWPCYWSCILLDLIQEIKLYSAEWKATAGKEIWKKTPHCFCRTSFHYTHKMLIKFLGWRDMKIFTLFCIKCQLRTPRYSLRSMTKVDWRKGIQEYDWNRLRNAWQSSCRVR